MVMPGKPNCSRIASTAGVITPLQAGTSTIVATQAASAGVNSLGLQTYTLTVSPTLVATQAVPSTTLTSGVAGAPFTPVAGSGNTTFDLVFPTQTAQGTYTLYLGSLARDAAGAIFERLLGRPADAGAIDAAVASVKTN